MGLEIGAGMRWGWRDLGGWGVVEAGFGAGCGLELEERLGLEKLEFRVRLGVCLELGLEMGMVMLGLRMGTWWGWRED